MFGTTATATRLNSNLSFNNFTPKLKCKSSTKKDPQPILMLSCKNFNIWNRSWREIQSTLFSFKILSIPILLFQLNGQCGFITWRARRTSSSLSSIYRCICVRPKDLSTYRSTTDYQELNFDIIFYYKLHKFLVRQGKENSIK
jgi:hypothetical protein